MIKLKSFYIIFVLVFVSVSFYNCSSISQSQRYGREKEAEKGKTKTVRFTSEKNDRTGQPNSYFNPTKAADEFDETPIKKYNIDKSAFIKKYKKLKNLNLPLTNREKILFEIVNYLDTPYLYGGVSKTGIDCSAFTSNVFNKALHSKLPRTASQQYIDGVEISSISNLMFGDLVFFNTSKSRFPGHVGIYLGNSLFAHASVSQGVTISNLKDKYYLDRFVGARRIEKFKGE